MTGFFSSLFSFELEIIEGCKLISLPLSLLNIRETFKLFTSSLKLCAGIGATKYLLEFNCCGPKILLFGTLNKLG